MASSMRNSLLKLAFTYIPKSQVPSVLAKTKHAFHAKVCNKAFTRNAAAMSSSVLRRNENITRVHRSEHTAKVHTEADGKLTQFLQEEISREKETVGELKVAKVEGWQVETDGTGVILRKSFKDESIKVEFDVNDSVMDDEAVYDDPQQAAAEAPAMVSKPPFEVEIKKKSGRTLTFMCEFTNREPEFEGQQQEEEIEDQFNIIEVRVDQPSDGVTKENFYSHSSSVMDGNLYEMLMDMLDERGVDNNFINNMVAFATSYEQQQYLTFLQKLHSVIQEK